MAGDNTYIDRKFQAGPVLAEIVHMAWHCLKHRRTADLSVARQHRAIFHEEHSKPYGNPRWCHSSCHVNTASATEHGNEALDQLVPPAARHICLPHQPILHTQAQPPL